ncbi:hypothetical protein HOD20_00755 [archaeon]|jgi:hypothetical protein|nr:hypothetical protein [archaeon]MBT4647608.1 hypothetical protein [archaeon]MBT6821503.1 hypothetical protein [archaeon]MBT7391245.1 hypothetical protein [archaeon]
MKKTISILAMLMVLLVSSAFGAMQFTLSEYNVNVPIGGSVQVELTVTNNGNPISELDLDVLEFCTENADPVWSCNIGDEYSPAELNVVVSPKTDLNGKAMITLTHDGSDDFGNYHYTICDVNEGDCSIGGASVTGDAYVPEFGVIGAGIALLGAGLFANKKRKN